MKLPDLLKKHKSSILKSWIDKIVHTYPPETAQFLKKQKDRFANPVGASISEETAHLFDQLVQGVSSGEEVSTFLDRIIRVRAVQDFTPTQALSFIFQLKGVIRAQLGDELRQEDLAAEMVEFDARVDQLGLLAFEIFMACREKLYDLRAKEMRTLFSKALDRSGIFCEIPEQEEPDIP